MSEGTASPTADISPYVSAAVGTYGRAVLAPGNDEVTDAPAGIGRHLLLRLFGRREEAEPLPPPLADLAADPADSDALAAVRLEARRMMAGDPVLAADVRALLAGASQQVRAERDAYTAAGNQTIINVAGGPGWPYWANPPGVTGRGPAAAGSPIVVGDIPQEPPGFQLRVDLLDELDRAGPHPSVVRALTGMRGVGKTQLAAAYARAKLADRWRLVAWVNAKETGSLLAGLAAVADAAGLTGSSGQNAGTDAGRTVRHWLETDGDKCLLVFDNVTDPDVLLPFVPAGGAAQVLITSALRSAANLGHSVGVEVFTGEEADAFLAGRTGLTDRAGAAAVAAELGFLPLALAQAAAVIAGQYLSYETYLDRLRSLPVQDYLIRERGQPYPHGVAESVVLSLEAVSSSERGDVCVAVLEMMAMLSTAGIRRELLYDAGKSGSLPSPDGAGVPAAVVDALLAQLVERSLLTFSLDRHTVSAHRLVMRVVRDGLIRQGRQTEVWRAAAAALRVRAQALAGAADRQAFRDIAQQVTALGSVDVPHGELEVLLRLRSWALYYLNELGDSAQQAIMLGEPLIADLEREQGPDHPDTLVSRNSLAIAYRAAGRAAEAIPLDEQTLAVRERVLGPEHPDTLISRNNLAVTYQEAGRSAEAIRLHEQTLAARQEVLGADHPDTLQSRNNLAAAYRAAGRPAEAVRLHDQTLAARQELLGADHPDTLQSRNNLANTYLEAGRAAEAIPLHEQTLAAREKVLGADHPSTLQSRNNLAVAYRAAGDTPRAIELHEQTLAARERVLGPDHPDTVQSRKNLTQARESA
jgi:tetratricopeptide (TPR) repeat protein